MLGESGHDCMYVSVTIYLSWCMACMRVIRVALDIDVDTDVDTDTDIDMGTDIHQEGNAEDVGDELLGCAMHAGGSAPTDITQTHRSGYGGVVGVHVQIV